VEHAPDFSIYGLVMSADPVVKGVMILLAVASVACWAIIFEKIVRIARLNAAVSRLRRVADNDSNVNVAGIITRIIEAAAAEPDREVFAHETFGEYRARLERAMRIAFREHLHRIESGLTFLATVGSAAPFVGLFGTVWGIVHSFTSIAQAKDTSLAVVAPGIAEALVATALGLAAAIPAVVAYNMIAVRLASLSTRANASIMKIAENEARVGHEDAKEAAAELDHIGASSRATRAAE
jgi:biopolymer transport protein ExbB/TolQ